MWESLLHIREYIGKNHEFAEWDADIHQVEFYFACSLIDPEATVFEGSNPDDHQVAVEWIALEEPVPDSFISKNHW